MKNFKFFVCSVLVLWALLGSCKNGSDSDGGKCIMQLRGVRPFSSDKFDITKHRRYKELSDFDPKNAFDIEDYVKHLHRMKVTPDTEVDDAFDCGEVEGDTTK